MSHDIDIFEDLEGFEEMKVLWDNQNEQRLFAINENALHRQIQRKGRSVSRLLHGYEWVMISANLLVGMWLTIDAYGDGESATFYAIPAIYLAYAVLFMILRIRRHRQDIEFEPTMLGDLDKAIWEINYLIEQSRSMILWFSVPLTIALSGYFFYVGEWLGALAIIAVMSVASFLSIQWEVNRCYLPKKESLEALRAKLVTSV